MLGNGGEPRRGLFGIALTVELGLGMIALAIGAAIGFSPARRIHWNQMPSGLLSALAIGTLAVIPLLVLLIVFQSVPLPAFQRLRQIVTDLVAQLFSDFSLAQVGLVSLAAGWGEELLFRGLLQDGLAARFGEAAGPLIGLVVASLLFGLAHCLSFEYFVVASIVGFYLGVLFHRFDSLLVPVITHALYDFLAILYIRRTTPAKRVE